MADKYAKLVMVTPDNNNKYYEMTYTGGSTFSVKYGRIESSSCDATYPIEKWDSKFNEKVRKGYKDVTNLVSVKEDKSDDIKDVKIAKIDDSKVDEFLTLMKKYTDNLVTSTYSVKATNVTQQQIDEAQGYIDSLSKLDRKKKGFEAEANAILVNLYMVIPRYMSNVKSHLLPNIDLDKTIVQEQDNLDAMASQVKMYKPKKKVTKKQENLLEIMGISMKEIKPTQEMEYLIKQCTAKKISAVFEVGKKKEDDVFTKWMSKQKNKQTRILIHGTRCTSVIPILEQGLKIRPSGNFQFSGKAYGDGNYFSETVAKSLGYTGYDNDQVLLVYEVHTGNPFTYDGWYRGNSFALTYKNLQERGYDSTFVKAGNGLLNSEIIAYNEEQCRIKYIIWLKR
jgi:poly [ADP-ribose] polymerase